MVVVNKVGNTHRLRKNNRRIKIGRVKRKTRCDSFEENKTFKNKI